MYSVMTRVHIKMGHSIFIQRGVLLPYQRNHELAQMSVFQGCGTPQSIPHANVELNPQTYGPISPGTAAHYTCHENYRNFSGSLDILCQDNGQWSVLKGKCEPETITKCYCDGKEVSHLPLHTNQDPSTAITTGEMNKTKSTTYSANTEFITNDTVLNITNSKIDTDEIVSSTLPITFKTDTSRSEENVTHVHGNVTDRYFSEQNITDTMNGISSNPTNVQSNSESFTVTSISVETERLSTLKNTHSDDLTNLSTGTKFGTYETMSVQNTEKNTYATYDENYLSGSQSTDSSIPDKTSTIEISQSTEITLSTSDNTQSIDFTDLSTETYETIPIHNTQENTHSTYNENDTPGSQLTDSSIPDKTSTKSSQSTEVIDRSASTIATENLKMQSIAESVKLTTEDPLHASKSSIIHDDISSKSESSQTLNNFYSINERSIGTVSTESQVVIGRKKRSANEATKNAVSVSIDELDVSSSTNIVTSASTEESKSSSHDELIVVSESSSIISSDNDLSSSTTYRSDSGDISYITDSFSTSVKETSSEQVPNYISESNSALGHGQTTISSDRTDKSESNLNLDTTNMHYSTISTGIELTEERTESENTGFKNSPKVSSFSNTVNTDDTTVPEIIDPSTEKTEYASTQSSIEFETSKTDIKTNDIRESTTIHTNIDSSSNSGYITALSVNPEHQDDDSTIPDNGIGSSSTGDTTGTLATIKDATIKRVLIESTTHGKTTNYNTLITSDDNVHSISNSDNEEETTTNAVISTVSNSLIEATSQSPVPDVSNNESRENESTVTDKNSQITTTDYDVTTTIRSETTVSKASDDSAYKSTSDISTTSLYKTTFPSKESSSYENTMASTSKDDFESKGSSTREVQPTDNISETSFFESTSTTQTLNPNLTTMEQNLSSNSFYLSTNIASELTSPTTNGTGTTILKINQGTTEEMNNSSRNSEISSSALTGNPTDTNNPGTYDNAAVLTSESIVKSTDSSTRRDGSESTENSSNMDKEILTTQSKGSQLFTTKTKTHNVQTTEQEVTLGSSCYCVTVPFHVEATTEAAHTKITTGDEDISSQFTDTLNVTSSANKSYDLTTENNISRSNYSTDFQSQDNTSYTESMFNEHSTADYAVNGSKSTINYSAKTTTPSTSAEINASKITSMTNTSVYYQTSISSGSGEHVTESTPRSDKVDSTVKSEISTMGHSEISTVGTSTLQLKSTETNTNPSSYLTSTSSAESRASYSSQEHTGSTSSSVLNSEKVESTMETGHSSIGQGKTESGTVADSSLQSSSTNADTDTSVFIHTSVSPNAGATDSSQNLSESTSSSVLNSENVSSTFELAASSTEQGQSESSTVEKPVDTDTSAYISTSSSPESGVTDSGQKLTESTSNIGKAQSTLEHLIYSSKQGQTESGTVENSSMQSSSTKDDTSIGTSPLPVSSSSFPQNSTGVS